MIIVNKKYCKNIIKYLSTKRYIRFLVFFLFINKKTSSSKLVAHKVDT